MSPILLTLLFGASAAAIAALALVLVRRAAGFTRRNAPLAAAFAGGLVITIALVHLIPEALSMRPEAPWLVLAGFAAGFVLHGLVGAVAHGGHSTLSRVGALAPVIAISLHSALDGTVYAVTTAIDPLTALTVAVGLILHEFPEALICFILLQRAGFSDTHATVLAFLAAGATTFTSAAIAAPFAVQLDAGVLGALFAVVAGLLLHVGAAHLLSEATEAGIVKGGAAVFAGAGVAAVMSLGHGAHHHHGAHSHDGEHHHDGDHDHDDHDHGEDDDAEQGGHTHHTHQSERPDFRPISFDGGS